MVRRHSTCQRNKIWISVRTNEWHAKRTTYVHSAKVFHLLVLFDMFFTLKLGCHYVFRCRDPRHWKPTPHLSWTGVIHLTRKWPHFGRQILFFLIIRSSRTTHTIVLSLLLTNTKWVKFMTNLIPLLFSTSDHRWLHRYYYSCVVRSNVYLIPYHSHLITIRCRELTVYTGLMPCTTLQIGIHLRPKGRTSQHWLTCTLANAKRTGIILSGSPYSTCDV